MPTFFISLTLLFCVPLVGMQQMIPSETTSEIPRQASNTSRLFCLIEAVPREARSEMNGKGARFFGHYGGRIPAASDVMMHCCCHRPLLLICEWGKVRRGNCTSILRVPTYTQHLQSTVQRQL